MNNDLVQALALRDPDGNRYLISRAALEDFRVSDEVTGYAVDTFIWFSWGMLPGALFQGTQAHGSGGGAGKGNA